MLEAEKRAQGCRGSCPGLSNLSQDHLRNWHLVGGSLDHMSIWLHKAAVAGSETPLISSTLCSQPYSSGSAPVI